MPKKSLFRRYFDLLVEPMFQRDDQGRELFFPMGLGSRGRVVPDAATGEMLRRSLRRAWIGFLGIFFLAPVIRAIVGDKFPASIALDVLNSFWFVLAPVALVLLMQFFLTRYLCRNLAVSDRTMTIANQAKSIASGHSTRFIYVMIFISALLTAVCASRYLVPVALKASGGPTWSDIALGGIGTLFFAAVTVQWIRTAIVKKRAAS